MSPLSLAAPVDRARDLVIFGAGRLSFGLDVRLVQEVLQQTPYTKVPRASPNVAGVMNIRGQVVTVIDVRARLGLDSREPDQDVRNIIVDSQGELVSLLVDTVGDVLQLEDDALVGPPAHSEESWRECAASVAQVRNELVVILDLEKLLSFSTRLGGIP